MYGQQGGYPPQQGGYPPQQQGGYPPQQQGGGYPPQQQGGYPAPPGSHGAPYPPQGGGGGGGYPPQQQGGAYPPPPGSHHGPYPPQSGGGYPPQQQGGGYPPQQQGGGYPPQQPPSQHGAYPPPPGSHGAPYPPQSSGGAPPTNWCSTYYAQINPQELGELQKWFRSVDRDNSGSITADELANVAIGGVRLGIETAIKLVRIFDVDNNGSIDFREYASLHKFLLSMQSTFAAGDKDRNGRLDSHEIHHALQVGGFRMSYQTCAALHRKYDNTAYGLNMGQFIQLVAHVALTKTAFEFRDREKKGYVVMSFDQLLEFSSII